MELRSADMKRWSLSALVLLGAAFSIFGVRHALKNRSAKKWAGYQIALLSYQQALRPGMTRKDVEGYLRSRNVRFQQMCCVEGNPSERSSLDDLIQIGNDDAPWYCSENSVYLALEFTNQKDGHGRLRADDLDNLEVISIYRRPGGCL